MTDFAAIDRYLEDALIEDDFPEALAPGLPPHHVSPLQGRLLELLARMHGARSILELGTLAGYSTLWLARAKPERLVTIEANERHAAIARKNLAAVPFVDLRVGRALEVLPTLDGPFDFFFIDADKKNNPHYFAEALRLSRHGSVIVVDNVIRGGAVVEEGDESVQGVRALLEMIKREPRVRATAVQTVGSKGHDGFLLAIVNPG